MSYLKQITLVIEETTGLHINPDEPMSINIKDSMETLLILNQIQDLYDISIPTKDYTPRELADYAQKHHQA